MMKPHVASLVHAVALIGLGGFGYLSSETPSVTALIPVVFGALLLAMNRGVKNENKAIAHVAVLLTLLIIVGLVKPLTGAMGRGGTLGKDVQNEVRAIQHLPLRDFLFDVSELDRAQFVVKHDHVDVLLFDVLLDFLKLS